VEGLSKVLDLERKKKFSDNAVVGGLDAYLRRLPERERFRHVLDSLPPGGYRSLHPLQRRRVIDELLKAADAVTPATATPRPPLNVISRNDASPPGRARTSTEPRPGATLVGGTLDSPPSALKGISRATQARLRELGIHTLRDFLFHFPRRYHDYSETKPIGELTLGEEQTVIADIWAINPGIIGRRKVSEAIVGDKTGNMRVLWWSGEWMAKRLRPRMRVALSGKVSAYRNRLQMENPEVETLEEESLHTRRLVPVYGLTGGVEQRPIRGWIREVVDVFAGKVAETLPEAVRARHRLMGVPEALRKIHVPDGPEQADEARRRFAFEELLHIELGVVTRRRERQAFGNAPSLSLPAPVLDGFLQSLPFKLTSAQSKALEEVLSDIAGRVPANRLLEGDVGSGKTVVALAALLAAAGAGRQGAIMAPTEILAEQHFRTLTTLLGQSPGNGVPEGAWFQQGGEGFVVMEPPYLERPLRLALLTGSLSAAEKTAAQQAINRGEVDIAVGTQALIQEAVSFERLGLVIVDEQHRFGVEQRAALREKGQSAHVLIMTATPIPRTLSLTVYGDLDITVLDEMPPGRPPVKTWRVSPQQRDHAYNFLRRKVAEGRQAYIIFPLVEASEAVAARAAVQEYHHLSKDVFPDLQLGLLHGRMPSSEKEEVMRAFRDGQLNVLVSTAVVEVGIDVPNATVILIEGADRFGLAQLHQFRGRVRRSSEQAYCFLLSDNTSPDALERLQIMETVNDGFKLAEEDLRLRGPGEYFGTRQSGVPDLRVAELTDVKLIEEARGEATRLLEEDPELARPEHALLRERMEELWGRITAEAS